MTTADSPTVAVREAREVLRPLWLPVEEAGRALCLVKRTRSIIRHVLLQGIRTLDSAYGAWDVATWWAIARTAREHAMSTMAIGCFMGAFTSKQALATGVQPLHFARRLLGRDVVEHQVSRVQQYLHTVGYGPTSADHPCFVTALATLMLWIGRPELEAITIEAIEAAHSAAPPRSERRSADFRLARALHRMELLPRQLSARDYSADAVTGVDPEWAAWCARWRATSTLAPRTAQGVYYAALRAGRWLAQDHPSVRTPDRWTRDLCIEYVAAVNDGKLGDLAAPSVYAGVRRRRGAPLSPRYKESVIRSLRLFFRDFAGVGLVPSRFRSTTRAGHAPLCPGIDWTQPSRAR
jgi:hypothetical protein